MLRETQIAILKRALLYLRIAFFYIPFTTLRPLQIDSLEALRESCPSMSYSSNGCVVNGVF